jgi:hypothetical protein
MKVLDLGQKEIARLLRTRGLRIQIGPFTVNLRSKLSRVSEQIAFFYGQYPSINNDAFVDFHILIDKPANLRHWIRPQAIFSFDGFVPFKPLPEDQAFAMFEWGLNWCIATTSHQFLIIHAAVVARNGQAIVFPGNPGAGKSTLCAAMVSRGWRLLSDEMALISLEDLRITPIPRPIGLKNESIAIMRNFDPDAAIGPSVTDTAKGTVAHMRPSTDSVLNNACALLNKIVFPSYSSGCDIELKAAGKARALARITEQSFNAHILGMDGFKVLERVVSTCPAFDLSYSQLNEAIAHMDSLIP